MPRPLTITWLVFGIIAMPILPGCSDAVSEAARNELDTMQTDQIRIGDDTFQVWLAQSSTEQTLGLMQTPNERLAPIPPGEVANLPAGAHRGMLFVFDHEQLRSFWMLNTIIPLDIAFIRSDGTIVSTHTMAPLETRQYSSIEPAQFALEVRAGLFSELGIKPGDRVEIPDSVLKADDRTDDDS